MPLIADPVYFAETIHRLADWARPREPDARSSAPKRAGSSSAPRSRTRSARLHRGAQAREAAAGDRRGDLRARVRHRQPRTCTATRSPKGARVIVLDDVLATGGTARAKVELVEELGGVVVGALFVIELRS